MKNAPSAHQVRIDYDPEPVKHEVLEVCDYYLRERRKEGRRYTYRCPECGGRRFEVEPVRGMAGCFSAECGLPKTTDAIGIIGYMEDLDTRGAGFIECLKKGYEILRLDAGDAALNPQGGGNGGQGSPKARSWIAGEAATDQEASDPVSSEADHDQAPKTPAGRSIEAYTEMPDGSRQPLEAFVVEDDTGEIRISSTVASYERAGGQRDRASKTSPVSPASHNPSTTPISGPPARRAPAGDETPPATTSDAQREINHKVFERLLGMCLLEDRDWEFLEGRGLDEATIREGRFGSISRRRSRYVTERLDKRFADEELLTVPGFYRAESGQLRFSLYGDYVLIPYYDREGYILTVEGRLTGDPTREGDPKYKALANSGVHLYVHPRFDPGGVVAFCEGAIGAMVAARCGIPVASIKGFRNYRQPPAGRGEDYSVLPELAGVDFGGKEVVYIPDMDVKLKTREEALGVVPEACEWLIERQGGRAKVALLPEGAKDLDEWLLSLAEEGRVPEFMKLLHGATAVEKWGPEGALTDRDVVCGSASDADQEPQEIRESSDTEDVVAASEAPISGSKGIGQKEMRGRGETSRPSVKDTHASRESGNTSQGNYRDQYFKRLPEQAPEGLFDEDSTVNRGEGSGSASNLPAQTGNQHDADEDNHQEGSREDESERGTQGARENDDEQDRQSTTDSSAFEEPEPGRRTHPSMQWWYDVSRQTPEQVKENRRVTELRDRVGYRRPRGKSARLDLEKWDFGEMVIATMVTTLIAIAACAMVYVTRPREDLFGTVAGLITFPVWWIEAAVYLALGWSVAAQVARARYVSRRRQLTNHVRGKKV